MIGELNLSLVNEHQAEIRRQVAANRLANELRASRRGSSSLMRDIGWELSRYAGLLAKRLRRTKGGGEGI